MRLTGVVPSLPEQHFTPSLVCRKWPDHPFTGALNHLHLFNVLIFLFVQFLVNTSSYSKIDGKYWLSCSAVVQIVSFHSIVKPESPSCWQYNPFGYESGLILLMWCSVFSFPCFAQCEVWGSAQCSAWSMGHESHFLLHISLRIYTCPILPSHSEDTLSQSAVSSAQHGPMGSLDIDIFPRLGSGDKGQICHLSSQISASSLHMILGNVSIWKYWQKNN